MELIKAIKFIKALKLVMIMELGKELVKKKWREGDEANRPTNPHLNIFPAFILNVPP